MTNPGTSLVLLCRHHHRALHEGGYRIEGLWPGAPVRVLYDTHLELDRRVAV